MNQDKLMFVGQKAFIEKEGKILVLFDKYGLDFPGGKIQDGETDIINSLKREVKEETDLEIVVGRPFYTFKDTMIVNGQARFIVCYLCNYISGEFKMSHEHDKFDWVNMETYTKYNGDNGYFKALETYFQKFAILKR
jgi:8-oxo-dGTP pyrophosphatase MutT (NUDIX family)